MFSNFRSKGNIFSSDRPLIDRTEIELGTGHTNTTVQTTGAIMLHVFRPRQNTEVEYISICTATSAGPATIGMSLYKRSLITKVGNIAVPTAPISFEKVTEVDFSTTKLSSSWPLEWAVWKLPKSIILKADVVYTVAWGINSSDPSTGIKVTYDAAGANSLFVTGFQSTTSYVAGAPFPDTIYALSSGIYAPAIILGSGRALTERGILR